MDNNKKTPIIGILSAINSGIPLLKDFVSLFKSARKKSTENYLNGMTTQQLIEHVKELESIDDKPFLIKLGNFLLTCATVYGVIYTAHKFGITYQDVINIFGLFK